MHFRQIRLVICALLTLQLTIGLQLSAAAHTATPGGGEHCTAHGDAAHGDLPSTTDLRQVPGPPAGDAAHSHEGTSGHPHCCGNLSCQCHGGFTATAAQRSELAVVADYSPPLPSSAARIATTRPHELFRPPIL